MLPRPAASSRLSLPLAPPVAPSDTQAQEPAVSSASEGEPDSVDAGTEFTQGASAQSSLPPGDSADVQGAAAGLGSVPNSGTKASSSGGKGKASKFRVTNTNTAL